MTTPRRRRQTSPFRARNIALGALALVAGLAGWSVFRGLTAVPAPVIDYAARLHALALSHQPAEGADAYPAFIRAIDIVKKAEDRVRAEAGPDPADLALGQAFPIDYSSLGDPRIHPLTYRGSFAAIDYAAADGLYRELDAAALAPRVVWPKPASPLYDGVFPHMGAARNLARMGAARMDLAAARGDWDELTRAFRQTLGVSRAIDCQGFLISRLVSTAIDALILDHARKIVVTARPPEPVLLELLAAIDASARIPFSDILDAERLGMLDAIQNMFTDDGHADGMLILTRLRTLTGEGPSTGPASWRIINVAGLLLPGKKATVAKCDELYAGLKTYAQTSPAGRHSLSFQPDPWVEALPRKYAALKVLAPGLGRAISAQDQHLSLWNGTRLLLALEIYQRRHAQYPDALDRLVPGILSEIPTDPFNRAGYGYRRVDPAKDPDGRAYTLYSYGADGKDDAGAAGASEGAPYSTSAPGGDFRFNSPK
jgi:hypothetical protein